MPKTRLSRNVVKQVERLGGAVSLPQKIAVPSADDSFVVLAKTDGEWSWTKESWDWGDKASEFSTDTAVFDFLNGVSWQEGAFTRAPDYDDDDERSSVEIAAPNENYEFRTGKKRVVLCTFLYEEAIQYYFTLDLCDDAADPTVFRVDHDGSSYSEDGSLSDFLATLEIS